MGNHSSVAPPQQNSNPNLFQQVRPPSQINHPVLRECTILAQNNVMKLTLPPVFKGTIEQWQSTVKRMKLSQPQFLVLPTSHKTLQRVGYCAGEIYPMQLTYVLTPYSLMDQIVARRKQKKMFQQDQIWYLLFVLADSSKRLLEQGCKIGDIRPHNIMFNQNGVIKIVNQFSWPNQRTNYQKSFQQLIPTYLSPEQVNLISYGQDTDTSNMQKSQSFSIGLTLLSILFLQDMSHLYTLTQPNSEKQTQIQSKSPTRTSKKSHKSINLLKLNQYLTSAQTLNYLNTKTKGIEKYSKSLMDVIRHLCYTDERQRLNIMKVYEWLLPYKYYITKLRPISLNSQEICESSNTGIRAPSYSIDWINNNGQSGGNKDDNIKQGEIKNVGNYAIEQKLDEPKVGKQKVRAGSGLAKERPASQHHLRSSSVSINNSPNTISNLNNNNNNSQFQTRPSAQLDKINDKNKQKDKDKDKDKDKGKQKDKQKDKDKVIQNSEGVDNKNRSQSANKKPFISLGRSKSIQLLKAPSKSKTIRREQTPINNMIANKTLTSRIPMSPGIGHEHNNRGSANASGNVNRTAPYFMRQSEHVPQVIINSNNNSTPGMHHAQSRVNVKPFILIQDRWFVQPSQDSNVHAGSNREWTPLKQGQQDKYNVVTPNTMERTNYMQRTPNSSHRTNASPYNVIKQRQYELGAQTSRRVLQDSVVRNAKQQLSDGGLLDIQIIINNKTTGAHVNTNNNSNNKIYIDYKNIKQQYRLKQPTARHTHTRSDAQPRHNIITNGQQLRYRPTRADITVNGDKYIKHTQPQQALRQTDNSNNNVGYNINEYESNRQFGRQDQLIIRIQEVIRTSRTAYPH